MSTVGSYFDVIKKMYSRVLFDKAYITLNNRRYIHVNHVNFLVCIQNRVLKTVESLLRTHAHDSWSDSTNIGST